MVTTSKLYLTDDDLGVVFQALCLAEAYYKDAHRTAPKGMGIPTPATVEMRLAGLTPLVEKIMAATGV